MLSLRKPSMETIRQFVDGQRRSDFSYTAVGASATNPPPSFVVDHTRVQLGSGEDTFLSGKTALRNWRQFQLDWVEACPSNTPIQIGEVVAVVAHVIGLWWLNAARIVYVIDEDGPVCRFGFAYGTLADHVESGEERFLIEWDKADDTVWYDILAFSRPRHVLARLGYLFARKTQKRFARSSAAAMQQLVEQPVVVS
ncbi:MAG: DUF1990 domain-containing protein [Planctomycetota bacterium]|nr:DUF1990 domain-containing protein [Planctomycetota bacterium]